MVITNMDIHILNVQNLYCTYMFMRGEKVKDGELYRCIRNKEYPSAAYRRAVPKYL